MATKFPWPRGNSVVWKDTLWPSNHGVLENTRFLVDFAIETPILSGFPIATLDYQRIDHWDGHMNFNGV